VTGPVEPQSPPRTRAALDELARLLLAQESTQSVLQRVVDLVKQVMPAGAEASITLLRNEHATTAAFTGELALQLDEAQYERGYGPCLEAAIAGRFIEMADARTEGRWPDYVQTFLESGALSLFAVPVPAAQLSAGLNVYAPVADAFTDQDRHALTEFAAYAAVALTNLDTVQDALELAGNLQAAMAYRSVIEQAKGILMERHKLTADQAFRLLAEASMHTNRKVRDLAEDLVLTGALDHDPQSAGSHHRPVARPATAAPDERTHPPDGKHP
jgi:GAF domain-containing protein